MAIARWWHEFHIKIKLESFFWDRFLTICDDESCHDSNGKPPRGWSVVLRCEPSEAWGLRELR